MDSWEKIEEEMAAARCHSCDGTGWIQVPAERKKYDCGDCVCGMNITGGMFADWIDRLRALGERDEKRRKSIEEVEWQVRHTCCGGCATMGHVGPCGHMAILADRLREAREGRDA